MPESRLMICGSIAIDRIMNFAGEYRELLNADKLHALSVSVLVDSLDQAQGGNAGNMTYALARLGEKPVLLGSVGHDAEEYLQRLEKAGVDIGRVHRSNLPTASFNVLTDSAGNQVGGFYPGAMADAAGLTFPVADTASDICVIAAHDPAAMRRQVAECAEQGARLVYDPGQQVNNLPGEDLAAGVAAAEMVMVNDYETDLLCKKTGLSETDLISRTPILVTTLGEKGSIIRGNNIGELLAIGPAAPAAVVDPTGAGDAYRAGFLYGYLRQWELRTCGQLGSVVASFALEQHGPQADLSRTAVTNRYRQAFNEEVVL